MTLAMAKARLSMRGLVLTKVDGEYRVTFKAAILPDKDRREAVAYYTNDITDAFETGQHMATLSAR